MDGQEFDGRENPGPLSNVELLPVDEGRPEVREEAQEGEDYVLLSEEQYKFIMKWYGGGPHIPRTVVTIGNTAQVAVRLEYRKGYLYESAHAKPIKHLFAFSPLETVSSIVKMMASKYQKVYFDCRLWAKKGVGNQKLLGEYSCEDRMEKFEIDELDDLMLESRFQGSFFLSEKETRPMSFGVSHRSQPGTCGLSNLGNTCFMNSALQCLSHSKELVEFFMTGQYRRDINKKNVLGTKGVLAEEYARLLTNLWSGDYSSFSPRDLKFSISTFAPQFSGYAQHDSHELLSFVMDGLHEDLNRVTDKPYTERVESNGRPDAVVAEEARLTHLKRHDSKIVDLFLGQFKSHTRCPDCGHVSIVFDPWTTLSLPLPHENVKLFSYIFISSDRTKQPKKYILRGKKNGTVGDLKKGIAAQVGSHPASLVVTDVYNHGFYKMYYDDHLVDDLRDSEKYYVYEVLGLPSNAFERRKEESYRNYYGEMTYKYVPVVADIPVTECRLFTMKKSSYYSFDEWSSFAIPFAIFGSLESMTQKQAYNSVLECILPYLSEFNPDPETMRAKFPKSDEDYVPVKTSSDAKEMHESGLFFTLAIGKPYGTRGDGTPIYYTDEKMPEISHYYSHEKSIIRVNLNCPLTDKPFIEALELDDSVDEKIDKTASLSQCFDLFSQEDTLDEENTWYCPRCKDHKQATRKMGIWHLPKLLVIHLKRFQYTRIWRDKLETPISFPVNGLDMSPWIVDEEAKRKSHLYDLYAISNHYGGLGGGHYVAHVKNHMDGHWYLCDDSRVQKVSASELETRSAYVLFYRLRESDDSGEAGMDLE
eukprot:TRINITY_DN3102_c0_g1_i1.p1 TRINITY_DN3102_c0_g1~~TRINITY_DN3102_c0_g1_i1.p1  ORF type:complete len:958 (+),score=216.20 TRINITY_DN3102_c0_g1_i1:428-2875(+)